MKRTAAALLFGLLLPATTLAGGITHDFMMSSAWCSFTFNKTTGYSNTKRFFFNRDGTFGMGGRGDGYSSGSGGTMASQANLGASGFWKVDRGELFMSEGRAPLQHVRTLVKRANNGPIVLLADGIEYTPCR